MKKILILSLIVMFAMTACKKTEIIIPDPPAFLDAKQVQWGLAINYTAKWCSPCGSWGAPLIHQLDGMGKVVTVTNHASGDPMYNATLYNGMSADRPTGGGIPSFWVGDVKTSSSSSSSSMTNLLSQTPIAGLDVKKHRSGSSMKIAVQVKFFSAGSGDYYLSIWLLESGIDGSSSAGAYAQNGASDPNYKHDFVFRDAYNSAVYGEKIFTNPTAGKVYENVVSMSVNSSWTNQMYVAACLWKFDPNGNPQNNNPRYKFVNGFVVK